MWVCHKFASKVPNQTMRSQTKACIAKSSWENLHYWDVTQHRVIIPYRHFGTTCRSHLPGSRNPEHRERLKLTETFFLGGEGTLYNISFFKEARHFGSRLLYFGKNITLVSPLLSYVRQSFPLYRVQCRVEINMLFYSVLFFAFPKLLLYCGWLETLWTMNLDQIVEIHKNNLDRTGLRICQGFSVSCKFVFQWFNKLLLHITV